MSVFFEFCFIFSFASLIGWTYEVLVKRYISKNTRGRWVNPGLLNGPYLPLYGICMYFFFYLSTLEITFFYQVVFAFSWVFMVELFGGLAIEFFWNIKLWDYSRQKYNYRGFVSLKCSIIWLGIVITYFNYINPIWHYILQYLNQEIRLKGLISIVIAFYFVVLSLDIFLSTTTRKKRNFLSLDHESGF